MPWVSDPGFGDPRGRDVRRCRNVLPWLRCNHGLLNSKMTSRYWSHHTHLTFPLMQPRMGKSCRAMGADRAVPYDGVGPSVAGARGTISPRAVQGATDRAGPIAARIGRPHRCCHTWQAGRRAISPNVSGSRAPTDAFLAEIVASSDDAIASATSRASSPAGTAPPSACSATPPRR